LTERVFFELSNVEQATAEIGWTCHPDHHGHGYMTEALTAFLAFAFADLQVHRITADIDSRNAPSLALASRLGMREEGSFVAAKWSRGAWRDMVQCALLDAEWSAASSR
jgi:RimJ/RimL family protein N-acetyltransferase